MLHVSQISSMNPNDNTCMYRKELHELTFFARSTVWTARSVLECHMENFIAKGSRGAQMRILESTSNLGNGTGTDTERTIYS